MYDVLPDLLEELDRIPYRRQQELLRKLQQSPNLYEVTEDCIQFWKRQGQRGVLSKGTVDNYTRELRHFRAYVIKRAKKNQATAELRDIRYSVLMDHVYRKSDGAPSAGDTHRTRYYTLRSFLRWIKEHTDYPVPVILQRHDAPKGSDLDPVALSYDQCQDLYRVMRSNRYGMRDFHLTYLVLNTGLRRSEAAALRVGDVDLDNKTLTVHRTKQRGSGPRRQQLPLWPGTVERMRDYLELRCGSQSVEECAAAPLFVSQTGKHLTGAGVSRIIQRGLNRIGVDEGAAHVLRHTTAILLAARQIPVTMIAWLLGHKNPETTLRYLRWQVDTIREYMERQYPWALVSLDDYLETGGVSLGAYSDE